MKIISTMMRRVIYVAVLLLLIGVLLAAHSAAAEPSISCSGTKTFTAPPGRTIYPGVGTEDVTCSRSGSYTGSYTSCRSTGGTQCVQSVAFILTVSASYALSYSGTKVPPEIAWGTGTVIMHADASANAPGALLGSYTTTITTLLLTPRSSQSGSNCHWHSWAWDNPPGCGSATISMSSPSLDYFGMGWTVRNNDPNNTLTFTVRISLGGAMSTACICSGDGGGGGGGGCLVYGIEKFTLSAKQVGTDGDQAIVKLTAYLDAGGTMFYPSQPVDFYFSYDKNKWLYIGRKWSGEFYQRTSISTTHETNRTTYYKAVKPGYCTMYYGECICMVGVESNIVEFTPEVAPGSRRKTIMQLEARSYDGSYVTLIALLKTWYGDEPVPGRTIAFYYYDDYANKYVWIGNATTSPGGVAVLVDPDTSHAKRTTDYMAVFSGDNVYEGSNATARYLCPITILTLKAEPVTSGPYRGSILLTANLTDTRGTPLSNKLIYFYFSPDNKTWYQGYQQWRLTRSSVYTGKDGVARTYLQNGLSLTDSWKVIYFKAVFRGGYDSATGVYYLPSEAYTTYPPTRPPPRVITPPLGTMYLPGEGIATPWLADVSNWAWNGTWWLNVTEPYPVSEHLVAILMNSSGGVEVLPLPNGTSLGIQLPERWRQSPPVIERGGMKIVQLNFREALPTVKVDGRELYFVALAAWDP
ncbi:MAG: hypothetical protein LM558_02835, partial [Thermosphaera sp.]|nr:hypothetical protein [Thermosphaera sp.]